MSVIDRDAREYLDDAMAEFGREVGGHLCRSTPQLVIDVQQRIRWMWCHDCEWRWQIDDYEWDNRLTPRMRNMAMDADATLVRIRTMEIRQEVAQQPVCTTNVVDLTNDMQKAAEDRDRERAILLLCQLMDPRYQGGDD